jgi:hypothetical protein
MKGRDEAMVTIWDVMNTYPFTIAMAFVFLTGFFMICIAAWITYGMGAIWFVGAGLMLLPMWVSVMASKEVAGAVTP